MFGVSVYGSMLALAIVAIFGALALTGIAMLIAAHLRSTETASGWANLFMLPMWLRAARVVLLVATSPTQVPHRRTVSSCLSYSAT